MEIMSFRNLEGTNLNRQEEADTMVVANWMTVIVTMVTLN